MITLAPMRYWSTTLLRGGVRRHVANFGREQQMTSRTMIAIAFLLTSTSNAAYSQSSNWSAVDDLRVRHFENAYKGKQFSDIGVLEYAERFWSKDPYAQIRSGERTAWCVVDRDKIDNYKKAFAEGATVRMTGTMLEWYLADQGSLLLRNNCTLSATQ
jgi:hypothetical protein